MKTFIIVSRGKGKKWFAHYGVNAPCLAAAQRAVRSEGFSTSGLETFYWDQLTAQKNFGGFLPGFREVDATEEKTLIQFFVEAFSCDWVYPTFERFLVTFPDAAQFRDQITQSRA